MVIPLVAAHTLERSFARYNLVVNLLPVIR